VDQKVAETKKIRDDLFQRVQDYIKQYDGLFGREKSLESRVSDWVDTQKDTLDQLSKRLLNIQNSTVSVPLGWSPATMIQTGINSTIKMITDGFPDAYLNFTQINFTIGGI
jgi:ABC-type Fe3+-hydroxamate transport system substrate-binding protein